MRRFSVNKGQGLSYNVLMLRIIWSIGITKDAELLRYEVFTLEQGFKKEDDVDEIDRYADEVVVYEDDIAVATARLFQEDDSIYHIGRLCVKNAYRGRGFGKLVLQEAERKAKEKGGKEIRLGAQYDKAGYYEKLQYRKETGELFDDAGYPHYMMVKIL